jgi:hypothetical protein
MNIFGAITIIVAILGAVAGAYVSDLLLPIKTGFLRGVFVVLASLVTGFCFTKGYFTILSNRAKAAELRRKNSTAPQQPPQR